MGKGCRAFMFSEHVLLLNLYQLGSSWNPILWGFCCYCLVTKSCLILLKLMDCSPPGPSVHGISQARILKWVVISFSRGSSQPRDWTSISFIGRWVLYRWATGEEALLYRCDWLNHWSLKIDSTSSPSPLPGKKKFPEPHYHPTCCYAWFIIDNPSSWISLLCVHVYTYLESWSCSVVSNSLQSHVAYEAPPSMEFSRQEYWSGLPFSSPGDIPNPGIKPRFPALQADALPSEPPGKPL